MAKSTARKTKEVAEEKVQQPIAPEVRTTGTRKSGKKGDSGAEEEKIQLSIEKKLVSLYSLQQVDSQIDKIRIVRGELPLEVEDLEDEIAGLETRLDKFKSDIDLLESNVSEKKNAITDSLAMIKKYEEQQMNVRNNREYDSITKELEYQGLEIQLAEKRIKEAQLALEGKKEGFDLLKKELDERKGDLKVKKAELDDIVKETEKEEKTLLKKSEVLADIIEERLLTAYRRIRKNARNGLAVVMVERDACGGCFNKIPPQHQMEIKMHKKIIVCEYCGRILVDESINDMIDIH
jgi:hypothetical protein